MEDIMLNGSHLSQVRKKLKKLIFNYEARAQIGKANSAGELKNLIKKFSHLVVELNTRDGVEFNEALSQIRRLRKLLSNCFKEERQQEINSHWVKVQKGNSRFAKRVQDELEEYRVELEEETDEAVEDFEEFEAQMDRLDKMYEELTAAQIGRVHASEFLKEEEKNVLDQGVIYDMHNNLNEQIENKLIFPDSEYAQDIPRPDFKDCVRKAVNSLDRESLKDRSELNRRLEEEVARTFANTVEFLREKLYRVDNEDYINKIKALQVIEVGFVAKLPVLQKDSNFVFKMDGFLKLKDKELGLFESIGHLKEQIKEASGSGLTLARKITAHIYAVSEKISSAAEEHFGLKNSEVLKGNIPFDFDPAAKCKKLKMK